jgi:hypothetical protein
VVAATAGVVAGADSIGAVSIGVVSAAETATGTAC